MAGVTPIGAAVAAALVTAGGPAGASAVVVKADAPVAIEDGETGTVATGACGAAEVASGTTPAAAAGLDSDAPVAVAAGAAVSACGVGTGDALESADDAGRRGRSVDHAATPAGADPRIHNGMPTTPPEIVNAIRDTVRTIDRCTRPNFAILRTGLELPDPPLPRD